jgi:outer membrane lipoprotein-sorting protein
MKLRSPIITITAVAWLLCSLALAQETKASPAALDSVLKKMDATSAKFNTTQANFVWEQYHKVVDDSDSQKGTVYYRRSGKDKDKDIEMMAAIEKPDRKFVLYKDATLRVYQPKIDQVMVHAAGASRNEMESYLVLGFGGSGQDLIKAFDVTYQGSETIDNIATAKLLLVPKSEKVRNTFNQIILWIDLDKGLSVQQKFIEPGGDYRLAKYSSIKVNEKINNDIFQLKTTNKTQTVSQ